MSSNSVFARTPAGDEAVRLDSPHLARPLRVVLAQLDGRLTAGEMLARCGMSSQDELDGLLRQLLRLGLIADADEAFRQWGASSVLPLSPDTVVEALDEARDLFGAPVFVREPAEPAGNGPTRRAFGREILRRLPRLGQLMLVCLLGVLLLVALYPYDSWRPRIEAGLARSLRQPVSIERVYMRFSPMPQLSFDGVRIGAGDAAVIATARLGWRFSWLWASFRLPEEIELQGAHVSGEALAAVAEGATPVLQRALRRVVVSDGELLLGERRVGDLHGTVLFTADGRFDQANLRRRDDALRITATRAAQGTQVEVEAFGWQPDDFPKLTTLHAKGSLQAGRLNFDTFDAGLLGGVARGRCIFAWGGEDRWTGEAALARIDMQQLTAAFAPEWRVSGSFDGQLRFASHSSPRRPFPGHYDVRLDGDIGRGALTGFDLGEAIRQGRGQRPGGSETRFERLSIAARLAPGFVDVGDIRLQAGALSAEGRVAALDSRVDGRLGVSLKSSAGTYRSVVMLGGSPAAFSTTVVAGRR